MLKGTLQAIKDQNHGTLKKKNQLEKTMKWKSQQYRIKQNRRADAKNYTLSMASFF